MSQCHDTFDVIDLRTRTGPLTVGDVMTAEVVTVEPTTTVRDIAHTLLSNDVRAVPVVDVGEQLVGIVSEADVICRECASRRHHSLGLVDRLIGHDQQWHDKADGLTAGEIMTPAVVTCGPGETIAAAARTMLHQDLRTLPVVDEGRLVGVVSRHDLLRVFDRTDADIRRSVALLLSTPRYAPDDHHITSEVIDGVVRLHGTVRYPSDAALVTSLVSQVPGVVAVHHHITAELPEPEVQLAHPTDWS